MSMVKVTDLPLICDTESEWISEKSEYNCTKSECVFQKGPIFGNLYEIPCKNPELL